MKAFLFSFALYVFIGLTFSCNKEAVQDHLLNTIYLTEFGKCFLFSSLTSGYVIDNDSSYQVIGVSNRVSYFSDCDTAKLPSINFSNYTLLGIQTNTSECDSVTRTVREDIPNKKYIYELKINRYRETCSLILKLSMNWVLVPKLPSQYKVEFIINNK